MNCLPLYDSHARLARADCLRIIQGRTASNPVTIAELSRRTGLDDRAIKGIVRDERGRGVLICSRKGRPSGYWWPSSPAEITEAAGELKNQALDMLRTYGRMVGGQAVLELAGQIRVEFQERTQCQDQS